ncbi:MAG: 1-acyl-sn-glycerol-3-phosphate acyltransferase, partial [Pseudomonadales bacterium]
MKISDQPSIQEPDVLVDLHHFLDERGSEDVLFIADASTTIERNLLDNWINSAVNGTKVACFETCFVDLAKSPLAIDANFRKVVDAALPGTLIIPLRVLWLPRAGNVRRIRDALLGNPHKPGAILQRVLLRYAPERCSLSYGSPATITELNTRLSTQGSKQATDGNGLAEFVVRQAVLTLQQTERGVRGSRYKQPRFVKEDILEDPEFIKDLNGISEDTGKNQHELTEEAARYIKELVPRSTPLGLDLLVKLSRFVYTRGYDAEIECDAGQIAKLRDLSAKSPVILLCNHRSQVDSFSLYTALFDNDLPHPHTFGGINMKMPIIGSIMRSAGMIFIRRAFSDNPVYKAVLQRYIDYLVSKRFPLLWSIEGGRSRTGKLIPPRYGLLHWLLNSAKRHGGSEPLHIVPTAIVFEQIADAGSYTREQLGGVKIPENLRWFFGYLRSFKNPLGKIHIRFGEPVLADTTSASDLQGSNAESHSAQQVQKLAFETCVHLNNSTPVTKASLICMVLLGAAPQALTETEMTEELDTLLGYMRSRNFLAIFPLDWSGKELLAHGLPALQNNGVISCFSGGIAPVYSVAENRMLEAAYYRNNAIHFLFIGAIADLALARLYIEENSEYSISGFDEAMLDLRKLLQWEFFFPEKSVFLQLAHDDLSLRHPEWHAQLANGKSGLREVFLGLSPILGHSVLEPYLDAYRVVAEQLANQ